MIDVSLVIVTYKESLDVLRACFAAVAQSTGVTTEMFVVDNGANDTYKDIVDGIPGATYIRNPGNMGFAYAVNRGMEKSQGRYVLLLNPDTEISPDAIAKMVAHMDADAEVGIGSAAIRYPDGTPQESIRRFPKPWDQLLVLLKLPHLIKHLPSVDRYMMRDADPSLTQDVDSIMGAFTFIRRSVMDKIGLFDERYFIWLEEVDYCKMAVDAGFKVRHYADVTIIHHKGHTFSQLATVQKQTWFRTSLRKYLKKHHGALPWLGFWALTPLFILLAYAAALIKKH